MRYPLLPPLLFCPVLEQLDNNSSDFCVIKINWYKIPLGIGFTFTLSHVRLWRGITDVTDMHKQLSDGDDCMPAMLFYARKTPLQNKV